MPTQKMTSDSQYIDTLLKSLPSHPTRAIFGTTKNVKKTGILKAKYASGIVPYIVLTDKLDNPQKNENITLSFFYHNMKIAFNSSITQITDNIVELKKPIEINISQQRRSSRYILKSSDSIQFYTSSYNKTLKVIDIGLRGVSILTNNEFAKIGDIIYNCSIKTLEDSFVFNGKVRSYTFLGNDKRKYGIELVFLDSSTLYRYLAWSMNLLNPEIFMSSQVSSKELMQWFDNSCSTLITNNSVRKDALYNEFRTWDQQKNMDSLQCNLVAMRNKKLVSAGIVKRIYNRTYYIQRLICIPGMHLHDYPKLSIYNSLSEILIHHPNCDNLIAYKDRDIEWHDKLFQELDEFTNRPSDVLYDTLHYIDIQIPKNAQSIQETTKLSHHSHSCIPCETYDEFISFIRKNTSNLTIKAYGYDQTPEDTHQFSELLYSKNHTMIRKIFKIKCHDTIIGYATCELYTEGYITDNSLNMCRLYFQSNKIVTSRFLSDIIPYISSFFNNFNIKRFRIIWKIQNTKSKEFKLKGSVYQGKLLRLICSKEGFLPLHQILSLAQKKYTKYYHLSYPQQSLWFYENLFPNTSINNISCTIYFDEEINFPLLEKVINSIVQHNDSLRIRIAKLNNYPCQYISIFKELSLSFIDFTKSDNQLNFSLFEKEWFSQPFCLFDSDLFQFLMFRKSSSQRGLFFKIHHIISDAWTFGLIVNNIIENYNKFKINSNLKINNNPSYINHLLTDYSYHFSQRFDTSKQFWIKEFKNFINTSNFKKLNNSKRSYLSKRKSFIIEKTVANKISRYLSTIKCSPFSFFLSCLYIYLHRISGEKDIIVGTTVLNRSGIQEKSTPGLFVNVIPIRIIEHNQNSFNQLIHKISTTFKRQLKHQKFPYELLIREIRQNHIEFDRLFDITVTYQNFKFNENLSGKWHPNNYQFESLNLHINDREGKGIFILDYDFLISSYTSNEIRRMNEIITNIINFVLKFPDRPISAIPIISTKEEKLILNQFNNTAFDYPKGKTIHTIFEEQVIKTPANIAVIDQNSKISYNNLNKYSNRFARFILQLNIPSKKSQFIAILIENSLYQIVAQLGILKSGNAYVPIDPSIPMLRIKSIFDDAKVQILISTSKYINVITSLLSESKQLLKVIIIDTPNTKHISFPNKSYLKSILGVESLNQLKGSNLNLSFPASEPAYAIYTSGSTGLPKGVIIAHKSVANLCWWYKDYYKISEKDIVARYISFGFDPSVADLFPALLSGATIDVIPESLRYDPSLLNDYFNRNGITVCILPTQLYELFQNYSNKSLRLIVVGGDKLLSYKNNRYNVYNNYGPTENTVITTVYPISKPSKDIPIGKPIANNHVYIIDKNLSLMPIGIPGEICIAGDGLACGYINNVDADKFVDNPFTPNTKMYKTGDIGKWLPDGNIEFVGRCDDQVKIRGFRIELKEIERVLLKSNYFNMVAVIKKASLKGESFLFAYYESDKKIDEHKISEYLSDRLPNYMIPSRFVKLLKLPLLPSGKIDRKKLAAYDNLNTVGITNLPKSDIEKKIFKILGNFFTLDKLTLESHFFSVGGDSIKAVEFSTKIEKIFNLNLPVKFLLGNPTFKQITDFIRKGKQKTKLNIPKAIPAHYYPATPGQQRLFFLSSIDPLSISYNMPGVFITSDSIDEYKFKGAFKHVINRHEILRTSFVYKDSMIVQEIKSSIPFFIESKRCDDDKLDNTVSSFIRPFNLSNPPLIRCALIHLNSKKTALIIDMHHIISDAVTVGMLIKELSLLYEGKSLSPLNLQYKDYSSWYLNRLNSKKFNKQRLYWTDTLNGELPVTNFPTDYKRKNVQQFKGNRIYFSITKKTTLNLRRIANGKDSTLFMVLLSCYYILLSKYSNQNDIIVGSVFSGRQHCDLSTMLGFFINTLPLRCKFSTELTFYNFLNIVKNIVNKALENKDYPFNEIISNLDIQRQENRNPLFDTMFIMQSYDINNFSLGPIHFKPYQYKNKTSKFDLTFQCQEKNNSLYFEVEYSTSLYKNESIKSIIRNYKKVINEICNDPSNTIDKISIISKREKEKIIYTFNRTEMPYPKGKTIHKLFEVQVCKTPHSTAIIENGTSYSYSHLNIYSNKIARLLLKMTNSKDSKFVGIFMKNSFLQVVAQLAVLKSGKAYIPIAVPTPGLRINSIINNADIDILITSQKNKKELSLLSKINQHILKILFIDSPDLEYDSDFLKEFDYSNLNRRIYSSELAYVMYTSGTTGNPKGVMIEHKSVVNLCCWYIKYYKITTSDIIARYISFSFDPSVTDLFPALMSGATVQIIPDSVGKDPYKLNDYFNENNISFCNLPAQFYEFFQYCKNTSLRLIVVGGDKLITYIKNNYKVVNNYGPTENTVITTVYPIVKPLKNIPIGKPIANTQVFILDRNNSLLPIGVPGELCISGDGLARGYIDNINDEKFVDNPFILNTKMYKTGDLAKWLPDGNILFVGRKDNQVKIRGFRIELDEIKNCLITHPVIQRAIVIIYEEQNYQKYIAAYIVVNGKVDFQEIKNFIKQRLPEYMVPSFFIPIKSIPLNSHGKIDNKALPNPKEYFKISKNITLPGNEFEKRLAIIWQKILGFKGIDINSNFFEIGGNSLQIITLVNEIKNNFHVEVSVRTLVENNSIKLQAIIIKNNRKKKISKATNKELQNFLSVISINTIRTKTQSHLLKSTKKRISFVTSLFHNAYENTDKVVFVNNTIPSEILFAFDLIPFNVEMISALLANSKRANIFLNATERNSFSNDLCSFTRCTIGAAYEQCLPFPEFLLFSSYPCDSSSRLFSHLSNFYKKELFLLDIPYNNDPQSVSYLADQLEKLVINLENHFNIALDEQKLTKSISNSNQALKSLINTNILCKKSPSPITVHDAIENTATFHLFGSNEMKNIFESYYNEAKTIIQLKRNDKKKSRILWQGMRPYYNSEIFNYLENVCQTEIISSFSLVEFMPIYWDTLDPNKPFISLAQKVLKISGAGPIENLLNIENVKKINEYKIDGVISFNQWGCRHIIGIQNILRDMFTACNIPFLELDGDYIDDRNYSFEPIKTRIDAFIELIKNKD